MKKLFFLIFFAFLATNFAHADFNDFLLKNGKIIVGAVGPALKKVSLTWSLDALQSVIDPDYFKDSKDSYIKMLKNASYLGEFRGCKSLDIGQIDVDKNKELMVLKDSGVGITGNCNYENGNAEILAILMVENSEAKLLALTIKPKK